MEMVEKGKHIDILGLKERTEESSVRIVTDRKMIVQTSYSPMEFFKWWNNGGMFFRRLTYKEGK